MMTNAQPLKCICLTDYLFLRPAKGREFVPLGEKASVNQDAMVMPVVWAGNMTTSNRSLQGIIF